MTLTEFLLARMAEDAEWAWHPDWCRSVADDQGCDCNGAARVLAECEAKRRIVVLHGKPHRCRTWDFEGVTDRRDPCDTIRALALPYADHPDYRDEWKP